MRRASQRGTSSSPLASSVYNDGWQQCVLSVTSLPTTACCCTRFEDSRRSPTHNRDYPSHENSSCAKQTFCSRQNCGKDIYGCFTTTAITLLMRTPRAPYKLFARGKIAVKTFMGALPQPRKRADLRALASRTDVFLHYFIV